MPQIHRSRKTVKPLSAILGVRFFTIPLSKANDYDPETRKPAIMYGVNGKYRYIPCGVPTSLTYQEYCNLRDSRVITFDTFPENTFDPL